LAAAVAFAIDTSLELGVAGGVLHVPAVLLALRLPRTRDLLALVALCTGLVILAWALSPPGGEGWKIVANRGLAIAAIWVVAGLGAAQRRGEELFRQALSSTPMGTLMVDREGRVVFANERAQQVFGYRDDMIGLEIAHLMPPRFREAHRLEERRFQESGSARSMGGNRVILGLHQDGREIPLEIGLAPVRRRGPRLVLVSVVDITQRAQATDEARLEHEEVKRLLQRDIADLHALLDRGAGLAVVTLDGRLKFANPAATRLLALDLRSDGVARLPVPLLTHRDVESTIERGEVEPTIVSTRAAPTTWEGEAALAISVADITREQRLARKLDLLEPDRDAERTLGPLAGRVLVVDDEPTVLELASSRLSAAGLGVLSARDGLEALSHLRRRGPFDVLVTDLVMPGIDGLQLAREAGEIQPGIEVLMISGHGPDVLRDYGVDVEQVRFLAKPFRLVELVRAVGGIMAEREADRVASAASRAPGSDP